MSTIRGVDFGTSTSLLAEATAFGSEVVPIGRRDPWIPSIVGLQGAQWAVGDEAADFAEPSLVRSVKRTITERREIVQLSDGQRTVFASADDAICDVLTTIAVRAAEEGVSITDGDSIVRLGCPAMWDGAQRRRLVGLANRAGLPVRNATLIDEPIAAGVAWVSSRTERIRGKLLIYDMGGGTLDIAVLDVDARPNGPTDIAVQAADGTAIAGDRVDEALVAVIKAKLRERGFDADGPGYGHELQGWLVRAAREAKIALTFAQDTSVAVTYPHVVIPTVDVTREEFEGAFEPLLADSVARVWEVARAALMSQVAVRGGSDSLSPSQARRLGEDSLAAGIDFVLLAGGMSRVPLVAERLGTIFGHDRIYREENPEQLIALGLGENRAYESLNLHRPGFDFVLEWVDDGGTLRQHVAYEAYTPFYDRHQVIHRDSVTYTHRLSGVGLPTSGKGYLRARSVSGDDLDLMLDGHLVHGIDFDFGPNEKDSVLMLEPNGRVFLRDSFGRTKELFIERWPVIKGTGAESDSITIRSTRKTVAPRDWYYDRSGD